MPTKIAVTTQEYRRRPRFIN